MNTSHFFLTAWTWNPAAIAACAVTLAGYLTLFGMNRRIGWLLGALAVLGLTLCSPVATLADGYLFSAHMTQHIILLLVVPAFLYFSLPKDLSLAHGPRFLTNPLVGWLSGVGAMWIWHAPALCNAAVTSRSVYALQTASLIVLGCLFWRNILAPRESERLSPPVAVLYLFSACVTCSILGIIITFAPVTVCSIYSMPPPDTLGISPMIRNDWGMSPERDQQIGGLLMWVPMCFIYLAAIFAQIARWFSEPKTLSDHTP